MGSSSMLRVVACGLGLLLAACGESAVSVASAEARAETLACTAMGGPGAVVTTSAASGCVGCSAVQPELAGDGDTQTSATVVVGANSSSGFALRVAVPGKTFAAGSRPGVLVPMIARTVGPGEFVVRTYLGEALQEEGAAVEDSSGEPLYSIGTTKPFDAVEIVIDSASTTAAARYAVAEVCGDSPAPPAVTEAGIERFFAPANGGQSWTLQQPGRYTTAEMRDWFASLEAAADSGTAVALPVSYFAGTVVGPVLAPTDQSMSVVLKRSTMLDEDTFFQINTVDHTGPFVRVYEGQVVDRPGSIVQLTLADDFMRGVARIDDDIFLVRVGTEGNLPKALKAGGTPDYAYQQPQSGEPVGCPADYIPNNNEDLPLTNGGHRWIPPYNSPTFLLDPAAAPELEARIILDADLDAYRQWGRHLPAMMIAMHVEQSVTYRQQLRVRFLIAGVHLNTIEGYYPTPLDTPATFDTMEAWWGGYMADRRDIVHLLTGQPINTYMASCIGAAGTPYGYLYTSTGIETRTASFRTMNFLSHEIAHLFSAHHHYGNHVEAPGSATIEIQGYTPGDVPVFSSLGRSVMRGWAEKYLAEAAE